MAGAFLLLFTVFLCLLWLLFLFSFEKLFGLFSDSFQSMDMHITFIDRYIIHMRLWDCKRLSSRNIREWIVNESLSISPCRFSSVKVFMLLRVMRLHNLIHWVSSFMSVAMLKCLGWNQIASQYIHLYIQSLIYRYYNIYVLCKDSNSMTQWQRTVFTYLGHAVNG